MATNLKMGFPDIPFQCQSITSSETYDSAYPVKNLVNGSRGKRAQLATALAGQHEIEFDLGSGVSQACDYLALLGAKELKSSGVTQVQLKGSSASYRVPSTISGLVSWLDPTKDVTYDSTTRQVTQINDQSGNGNHATDPASAANRPLYSRADNRENFLTYSEQQSNSAWDKSTYPCTAIDNDIANFEGRVNATRITATAGTSRHGAVWHNATNRPILIPPGSQWIYEVDVKAGTASYVWIGDQADSAWHGAGLNLTNGTWVSLGTGVTKDVTSLGNGWYRVKLTITAVNNPRPSPGVWLANSSHNTSPPSIAAAGTETFYMTRAQLRRVGTDNTYLLSEAAVQIAGINGNRSIVFDGSNDYLLITNSTLSGSDKPFTILAAFKSGLVGTSDCTIMGMGNSSDSDTYQIFKPNATGGGGYVFARRDDGGTTKTISGGSGDGNTRIASLVFTGTTGTAYIDGVSVATGDLDVGTTSINRIAIGARYLAGAISLAFSGKIGDFIIYDSALGTSDRQAVEAYLTSKWVTTAAATIDVSSLTLQGGQDRDYITTFSETSACRYWIVQMESDLATLRPLSKLYFGKLFDMGRDPQFQREGSFSGNPAHIYQKKELNLDYKGISTTKRLEFEEKIGQFSDTNEVVLVPSSYTNLLLGESMLSCAIKDYSFDTHGARQNSLKIALKETF